MDTLLRLYEIKPDKNTKQSIPINCALHCLRNHVATSSGYKVYEKQRAIREETFDACIDMRDDWHLKSENKCECEQDLI